MPLPPKLPTGSSPSQGEDIVEYSTKEVKPAALLIHDLVRAHTLFLLHHDVSLSGLFRRLGRRRFVSVLAKYWDLFLSTWSVIMHGNPIRSVLGGINVAASGELGIGVGEEDRGSGEREVLEGLVGRIDGLVDLVVARFGEAEEVDGGGNIERDVGEGTGAAWLGTGQDPGSEDGAIFLGVGALTTRSLRDVVYWTEDLYMWGENAYGVIGALSAPQSSKSRGVLSKLSSSNDEPVNPLPESVPLSAPTDNDAKQGGKHTAIPPKEGEEVNASPAEAALPTSATITAPGISEPVPAESHPDDQEMERNMDKLVNMLKLGYGTYWSLGGGAENKPSSPVPPAGHSASGGRKSFASSTKTPMGEAEGYFLIGLKGTIEEQAPASSSSSEEESASEESATHTRTLHVSLAASTASGAPGQDAALRAVVYVNKPFIFTFLFDQETPSLSSETLYRSLHYQLSPLRRHLLLSTRYRPPRPMDLAGASTSPASPPSMHDLVWDRGPNLVYSTIPNIPAGQPSLWTRAEAVATHTHLLAVFASRRARDTEKTLKTNKGWWIVWSSVSSNHANISGGKQRTSSPRSSSSQDDDQGDGSVRGGDNEDKEVILLRRAGDHSVRSFSVPGRDSTARLAQGIGLDTRGYVETLLSLGR